MKDISFSLPQGVIKGQLGSRITKRDLYDYSKKIVEKAGHPLTRGYLSASGQIMTRSEVASVRLDPEGTPITDLIYSVEGEVLELLPSAFDQDNPLDPVPLTELVGFNTQDVYPLSGLDLAPGLYKTYFSYRKSYTPKEALVLVKEDQAFLLTGTTKKTTFVGQTVIYDFF